MAEYVWIAWVISGASLFVSLWTAWMTLGRRGKVVMTQPTFLSLTSRGNGPVVQLTSFIYSTAKRGNVIESLFLKLKRGETHQTFNVWVFGAKDSMSRGSGLFVTSDGSGFPHYFMLPRDGTEFSFLEGDYTLEVFAREAGKKDAQRVLTVSFTLKPEIAKLAKEGSAPILLDWGAEHEKYHVHIDTGTKLLGPAAAPMALSQVLSVELVPLDKELMVMGRAQSEAYYRINLRNHASFPITPKSLELTLWLRCGDFERNVKRRVEKPIPTLGPNGASHLVEEDWLLEVVDPRTRVAGAVRLAITGKLVAEAEELGGKKDADVSSFTFGWMSDRRLPPP
jgi:hypothetical protein